MPAVPNLPVVPERLECPFCGTSYLLSRLKLKTGPADKAIIRCACGEDLAVTFDHVLVDGVAQTWTEWALRRKPAQVVTVVFQVTRYVP